MKKIFLVVLCLITINSFAGMEPLPKAKKLAFSPPTFKQDWETFQSLLLDKAAELAQPNADSVAIYTAIKAATDLLDSKWDVDEEMKNKGTLWPYVVCVVNCSWLYYDCQKSANYIVHGPPGSQTITFWPKDCMSVFQGCVGVECR